MSVASVPQVLQEAEKFAASHRAYANELAPAYADFHNSVASLLERLAAALTESQQENQRAHIANGMGYSELKAALEERDALRAQREALAKTLREIVAHKAAVVPGFPKTQGEAEAFYDVQERARAVLAQGKEP